MQPTSVEVIAPVLTDLRHCSHCEIIFGQTEVGRQVHREEENPTTGRQALAIDQG